MPLIEKPNRAEILAEKGRKKREEELNTRNWRGLEVYFIYKVREILSVWWQQMGRLLT